MSWHGPCVCAGRGGGGGGSLPRLAWSPGNWEMDQDGGPAAPPAEDRHRPHLSQTLVSAPALRHISHTSPWAARLRITSHRGTPSTPPHFPEPPSAPGPGYLLHLLAPCPSHSLLGPTKQGPPCRPGPWWAQRKAPVPPSWCIACSQGPHWQAPRAQPPASLLHTGPWLGCLMIFSWRSSLLLHSSTYTAGSCFSYSGLGWFTGGLKAV